MKRTEHLRIKPQTDLYQLFPNLQTTSVSSSPTHSPVSFGQSIQWSMIDDWLIDWLMRWNHLELSSLLGSYHLPLLSDYSQPAINQVARLTFWCTFHCVLLFGANITHTLTLTWNLEEWCWHCQGLGLCGTWPHCKPLLPPGFKRLHADDDDDEDDDDDK